MVQYNQDDEIKSIIYKTVQKKSYTMQCSSLYYNSIELFSKEINDQVC